jgi:hypothetical protein
MSKVRILRAHRLTQLSSRNAEDDEAGRDGAKGHEIGSPKADILFEKAGDSARLRANIHTPARKVSEYVLDSRLYV